MTGHQKTWIVRLTKSAEEDFRSIVRWSELQFGTVQARTYSTVISDAIATLSSGPNIPGARARPEILKGVYTLHVSRSGHKGIWSYSASLQRIPVRRSTYCASFTKQWTYRAI